MKKLIPVLLCLCLLLGGLSAQAEDAGRALPQPGDVVFGFEVKDVREFPLVGGDAVLFEHQKTGAMLTYIANEDTNRLFDLTFLTRPLDNTGLPHVFEHSTLDGSDKYPSKALWFNLNYQTYNTLMNAYTYSHMTTYPVASLSEAQLLKYADLYTDSCLHPMLLTDESIFREEAWRYRLPSAEDELTIEGTVYSEMQGAVTLSGQALLNAFRTAYPGSVMGFNQGGDPDFIPDMTWEAVKNYHAAFYHPSNCMAYLYGQFDDYTAFLALLDEAFSAYEKTDFHFEDSGYTPITAPQEASFGFPVEAGSAVEHQSNVYYLILCPGLRDNPEEELILNTLTDVLLEDSSVLQQSLKKALPTGAFGCYIETRAPDDAICFYAVNVDEGDGPLFKQTVDEALAQVAAEGFAQDMVDGVMHSLSLNMRLTMESSDVGSDLVPTIAYSYAASGRPFDYLDYVDGLAKIDEWNQQGLYQAAVQKWLAGSELTALTTTYPVPGAKEEKNAALAAKLAEYKASLSEEEIAALVERTNAAEPEEDTSAMVTSLQAVTVESLPEEVRVYDVEDDVDDDGVHRMDLRAGVEGIGQVALFLDASGLPQEDIHWFKLFTQLLGRMDTDAHTHDELDLLTAGALHDLSIRQSLIGMGDEFDVYLRATWIGLDEDLAPGYDLVYELLFGTQFTDTARLGEQITALKTALRSSINGSPYNVTLYRSLAVSSSVYRFHQYINYIEYYQFLEQAEALMASDPAAVTEALVRVQSFFHNRHGAFAAFAGSEESSAVNRAAADAFLAKLDAVQREKVEYDLPVPAHREALIADTGVQFNGVVSDFASMGMADFEGSLDVISTLVSDTYLIPRLRDQYGVYAPWAGTVQDGGVYLLTYRDPNVAQTFEVYAGLPEFLRNMEIDQATLDGYILSAYASYAKPTGELAGALTAILNLMEGRPQDAKVTYMQQLKDVTPETVKLYADRYQAMLDSGVYTTAGSAAAINANAERYDVILNPFNAKDTSQVEFTDVPADSENYAAIRFAYENGLMASATDDTFDPDGAATAGDLMAAIYAGLGGPSGDPEGARDWLAGYGLVPGDLDVKTELTEEFAVHILANGLGVGISTDTPDKVMTRAELAGLAQMLFDEGEEAPAGETPAEEAPAEAVEFTDVPADSEHYAAIRFAVESGLMDPAGESAFAPDAPATAGDLMAALCRAMNLPAENGEAARQTLAGYGLVPADLDVNTALTEGFTVNLFSAAGAQLETDTPDLEMSRADLADLLYSLLGSQEAPAEETPAEEVPADKAPVEEAPAAEEAPDESAQDLPWFAAIPAAFFCIFLHP